MRLFPTKAFLLCLSCLGVQLSASAQHSIGNPGQDDPLQLGIPRPTEAQRRIANPKKLTLTTTQRSDNRCNLVANGDFEIQFANTPPSQDGNIQSPITTSANQLPSWFAPNYTSPDYLARNGVLDNPPNPSRYSPAGSFRGAVTPLNGSNPATQDGTVGIVYSTLVPGYNSYPEYIAQNLAAPLTPNALYYAEFYAQPASQFSQARALRLFVADNTNGAAVDNNNASVLNSAYGITSQALTNLGSWQRVSGTFTTGSGPYNFLCVGYNNPSASNNTPLNNSAPQAASYYYIDDVALYKVPTAGSPVATHCTGPLTIGEGCDIPNAHYAWTSNPSSSTPLPTTIQIQVNPQVTTVYTLTVTLPDNTTTSSSVTVTANPPSAGPDQTICPGQSATLGQDGCNSAGYTYAWRKDGEFPLHPVTTLHYIVSPTETTTYILTVRRPDGTYYSSSVTVTVDNRQMYGIDVEEEDYCANGRLYLIPNLDPGAYDSYYSSTLGYTYTITSANNDIIDAFICLSPISGKAGLSILPRFGQAVTDFSIEMTYHYATGCTASNTFYGYDGTWCQYQRSASVSPNPASSKLLIEDALPAQKAYARQAASTTTEYQLYNAYGQLVKQGTSSAGSLSLDVQDLPNGIYYLRSGTGKNALSKAIEVRH